MASNRNLIVLVGAGASYDCHIQQFTKFVDPEWTPPLTPHLFSSRPSFQRILNRFPKAHPAAAAYIARSVANSEVSIEQFLRELLSRPDTISKQQGLFISLYLRDLFTEISTKYLGHGEGVLALNAYTELVGGLYEAFSDGVFASITFLTTNYDYILDRALEAHFTTGFSEIQHYLDFYKGWSLVKFHGSANWWYKLDTIRHKIPVGDGRASQRTIKAVESGLDLRALCSGAEIEIAAEATRGQRANGEVWFPAIAIPVDRKEGAVCPEKHTQHIETLLADQTCCFDLLVLGFSAVDLDVLKVFENHWQRIRRLLIVNGKQEWSAQTQQRLFQAGLKPEWCVNWNSATWNGGFSDWILNRKGFRVFTSSPNS